MDLHLKGKKVLITGGSRGIGKAIAEEFVNEGARVGVVARNQSELLQVKKDLRVRTYQKDLIKQEEREQLIKEFVKDNKGIDILVNNVGAGLGERILSTPHHIFEEALEINFIAAVQLSQLASKEMLHQGEGVIINISSIYGKESGGTPPYNASKSALISFTKSLSTEVIKNNIRVVGIAPGAIYHPNKEWTHRLNQDPQFLEKYATEKIPAGRMGKPEEIGKVAVFLASSNASWIVGSTITVDGGQSRMNF